MTTLDRALSYLERGCNVLPIPRPDDLHDGKRPATKECARRGCHDLLLWSEFQQRRQTTSEVIALFVAGVLWNIAIITGAVSDLVAIDGDSPEAIRWLTRRLPYTPWQTQTGKGFHLLYRSPGVEVRNRSRIATRDGRLKIDVRGDGGYVIAPGSIHASGVEYLEAGDWSAPRGRVPKFWPGWLERPKRVSTHQQHLPARPTGDIVERARRYLAHIPRPEIGHGSDVAMLSAACRLVRGFDLPASDATALLWEWAGGRPGWTYSWVAEKVAHALRYGTEPIGALR